MPETVTNRYLAKVSTTEFLIGFILATFALGGTWHSINTGIAQAQETADSNVRKAAAVEVVVNAIQTDVAVIKANQANAAQNDIEQTKQLEEQRKDIKTILRLVGNDSLARQQDDD